MTDYFQDVGEFHAKFGLPTRVSPNLLTPEEFRFRWAFLNEELQELAIAWATNDLPEMADALCDLVWVALGTAHMMGLEFDAHWNLVKGANMTKERATGDDDPRSKRGSALDVVKPPGWRPPDHQLILRPHSGY